jgi:hypothetical protein
VDEVPDDLRRSFERLRLLHTYGILYYETFTVVYEGAYLMLEQVLVSPLALRGASLSLRRGRRSAPVRLAMGPPPG